MKDKSAVSLGKRGGKVKSERKAIAVRENGKKGGRPKQCEILDCKNKLFKDGLCEGHYYMKYPEAE